MDGQLCYKADVNRFSDMVLDKKKIVTEGLVILLDYNENRMVEVGEEHYLTYGMRDTHKDAILYIETIGMK